MSPDRIVVFVNAERVEVPAGATALDAVRAWSVDAADEVARGTRIITDSRGLPAPPDAPVTGGSIFRLVPSRARGEGEPLS